MCPLAVSILRLGNCKRHSVTGSDAILQCAYNFLLVVHCACITTCITTGSTVAAASDIHRQLPTNMADIRRDWLTNQNTDWCFVVIGLEEDIPQSFATAKNRSSSPNLVRHIGWHLAEAREYLLTSVASTVSRRIYIYIH